MKDTNLSNEQIILIVSKSQSMTMAAKLCGMSYGRFKRIAKSLGIFKTNQSHKGIKRGSNSNRIKTEDILAGKFPQYNTYKLKVRLIKEGIKEDKCEKCGWAKKINSDDSFTPCELHHINGNPLDHRLENLIILCPNCHSLTKTYRFRRGKTNKLFGLKLIDKKNDFLEYNKFMKN